MLAALKLATALPQRHVVLALDDVTSFAEAAQDLGVPPISGPQIVAAALEAAGSARHSLSVVMALDLSPEHDLATVPRELWRSAEPSLDICVPFSQGMASRGVPGTCELARLWGTV